MNAQEGTGSPGLVEDRASVRELNINYLGREVFSKCTLDGTVIRLKNHAFIETIYTKTKNLPSFIYPTSFQACATFFPNKRIFLFYIYLSVYNSLFLLQNKVLSLYNKKIKSITKAS